MVKFIVLFACLAFGAPHKDFLEGLLSGFQGTAVQLGENCLDPNWADTAYSTFDSLVSRVRAENWFGTV